MNWTSWTTEGDEADAAALRRRLTGVLENLPQALKRHLEALLALENKVIETREQREARVGPASPKRSGPNSRIPCAGWRAACTVH